MPSVTERGSHLVAFSSVVVNHIQDHFDPLGMEPLYHALEFMHGLVRVLHRCVGRLKGEVGEGVVSPVVGQSFFHEVGVIEMMMHRQQFDGGDSERFDVFIASSEARPA